MSTGQPNQVLTELLTGVGWSPYDLARAVNKATGEHPIHRTTPFAWRDKGVVPHRSTRSLVAGVLTEATGRVVTEQEIWPHLPAADRVHQPAVSGLDSDTTAHASLAVLNADPLVRPASALPGHPRKPRYFAVSGDALTRIAARWGRAPEILRRRGSGSGAVTRELVAYLERDAAALRRLDDGHGGNLVQHAAAHQLSLTVDLLANSRYQAAEGRTLAAIVAQLAQLTGWLHFDLDDHGTAQRCYLLGLRAAGLAGDRPLAAMILSALAAQQTWRGHPRDALALLAMATADLPATTHPRVKAILFMREARAHATTGNEPDATRAMRRAERELDATDDAPTPAPVWAYWLTHPVLTNEIGKSLLGLGHARPAAQQLDHGIGLLTDTATRDRVLYTLSLAKAYATSADNRTGDIDRACHETATILPLFTHVSSARCRTQLTDLIATLRHHRGHDVRDLREQAAQALAAPV